MELVTTGNFIQNICNLVFDYFEKKLHVVWTSNGPKDTQEEVPPTHVCICMHVYECGCDALLIWLLDFLLFLYQKSFQQLEWVLKELNCILSFPCLKHSDGFPPHWNKIQTSYSRLQSATQSGSAFLSDLPSLCSLPEKLQANWLSLCGMTFQAYSRLRPFPLFPLLGMFFLLNSALFLFLIQVSDKTWPPEGGLGWPHSLNSYPVILYHFNLFWVFT